MAAVTRFGLEGYGVRRAGSFAGKTVAYSLPADTGTITLSGQASTFPVIPTNPALIPGNSLVSNLLACYLPGVLGGVPVSGIGPTLANGAGGAGTIVSTVEGPASRSNTLGAAKGLTATAPSVFKTWTNFTVYWRGLLIGTGDIFCPVVGVSSSDADVAPYFMLNVAGDSDSYAHVRAFYGDSSASEATTTFDATGLYGQIVDFCATATVGGSVTFYVNGASAGTGSLTTISTSASTSKIVVNQGIDATNRSPNASVNMACFWDRALSSTEIANLHSNPYSFLKSGYTMPAGQGALTLAGQTAALRAGRKVVAGQGTLTLSGQTATLKRSYVMPAGTGTLTLSGQTAALRTIRSTAAGLGTLTLAGQTVALKRKYVMPAGQGTLTLTGVTSNLIYSGAGSKSMPAGLGTIALSGQVAITRYGHVLTAGLGTLTLSGQTATLRRSRVMPAGTGTITLSGQTTTLKRNYVMPAGAGTLTLSGQVAALKRSRVMPAGTGTIALSGQTVNLVYSNAGNKILPASTGTIVLNGQTATLRAGHVLKAGTATTWSTTDLSNVTLSLANLRATGTGTGGVRATNSQIAGKDYFEQTYTTVGTNAISSGLALASANLSGVPGTGIAYVQRFTGSIIVNGSASGANIGLIGSGVVIGIAVDITAGLIWFKNITSAGNWNGGGTANPATGVGGISIASINTGPLYPIFMGQSGDVMTANFGASAFSGVVPSGFAAGWPGDLGTLRLDGQTAALRHDAKMPAGLGTITMFGPVVNLIYSGAGNKVLPAGVGVLRADGQTVVLRYAHKMVALNGVLTLDGQSANLVKGAAALAGVKVWSGSAWVTKPAKVWTGSAWVAKPVKHWNGSAWV